MKVAHNFKNHSNNTKLIDTELDCDAKRQRTVSACRRSTVEIADERRRLYCYCQVYDEVLQGQCVRDASWTNATEWSCHTAISRWISETRTDSLPSWRLPSLQQCLKPHHSHVTTNSKFSSRWRELSHAPHEQPTKCQISRRKSTRLHYTVCIELFLVSYLDLQWLWTVI